jgi:hypothetical protein
MTCGCTEFEIFILDKLWVGRNLRANRGHHIKKLKNSFQLEFREITNNPNKQFDDSIQRLKNQGIVTQVRKKEIKFWISDITMARKYLQQHGKL